MSAPIEILREACTCGHDHKTHRGEYVEMCLECSCTENIPRCQNCGGEVPYGHRHLGDHDVCSARCKAQLEYALARKAAA